MLAWQELPLAFPPHALQPAFMTENNQPLAGACHCGAVRFTVSRPEFAVSCNCSICRRYRALWAHCPPNEGSIEAAPEALRSYTWGDGDIAFNSCATCGCLTHWSGTKNDRFAVNLAMVDPAALDGLRIRHFDGADSWEFLD